MKRKMPKAKQQKKQNQTDTLASRIVQLRNDCQSFLDEEARRQSVPGVPVTSIRQILTARHPNNVFEAVLAILENERE
jgi:hypothetical protein